MKKSEPDWAKIAEFYAGRPIKLGVDTRGPLQATSGLPESGQVLLGAALRRGLRDWAARFAAARNAKEKIGLAGLGVNPLAVLIHESIHNRHFTDNWWDETNPGTGFRNAGDERQAAALGAELIPDLLQRFFGVKIGSPVSNAYAKAAKSRSEYQSAYQKALDSARPSRRG